MTPYAGEPDLGPWAAHSVEEVRDRLLALAGERRAAASGRSGPLVVAVDGRSAGGKSTVAGRLVAATSGAALVHTDDVAWQHDFFAWDGLLVEGVLEPLVRGEAVAYRPPGWVRHDRDGALEVAPDASVLVVEGVGASRRALTSWLDVAVWVQSDADEARRRGIERDVSLGRDRPDALAFWDEWMAQEVPFLAVDRPWERADLVVNGTPDGVDADREPGSVLVSSRVSRARAGPGGRARRTS